MHFRSIIPHKMRIALSLLALAVAVAMESDNVHSIVPEAAFVDEGTVSSAHPMAKAWTKEPTGATCYFDKAVQNCSRRTLVCCSRRAVSMSL